MVSSTTSAQPAAQQSWTPQAEVVELTTYRQNRLSTPTATKPSLTGGTLLGNYYSSLLASGRSTGTARLYTNRLERLQLCHPDLLKVTTDDLVNYLALRRTTHKAETRKSMRSAFRSFYGWAFKRRLIVIDPAYPLEPIRIPASVPRVAADDIVQRGLMTAGTQLTAMIMLARFGCLRLSELTTLHTAQREGDLLRITGKGEKQRLVPANDELLHALLVLEREQGDGYYFPGRWGGSMHPQSVNKIITRHLGTNPHSLRHAGATAAYLANPDMEALRMFLGHASVATTQRYLHVGMDAVRRVANSTVFTAPAVSPHFKPFTSPPATPQFTPLPNPVPGAQHAA